MNRTLTDYYRCPEEMCRCYRYGEPSPHTGYFRFGHETICYGSVAMGEVCSSASGELYDAMKETILQPGRMSLSFDPAQAVEDLRLERYYGSSRKYMLRAEALATNLYYLVRPWLGVSVRRRLQKLRLAGWRSIPFPRWPVDLTVEQLHGALLRLCIPANGAKEIPFIWFWPNGFSSCVVITHDVETTKGRDFCPRLMDLDESFGIKSSFQLIPEDRYSISSSFLKGIRSRGFEVNIHDLNHDGRLFSSKATFLQRACCINRYAREFGALGFRSGALYRNLSWYGALNFSYDMSVPNIAHLDPQRGGCCTVMPYFAGNILEIPLTTTQDYVLFHILGDYSIALWQRQLDIISKNHGIATFDIHPDYVIEPRANTVYVQLLEHIAALHSERGVWLALPGEVDAWWRNRAQMQVVRRGNQWAIEGPGCQQARLAYARIRDHKLEYSWTSADSATNHPEPAEFPAIAELAA